MRSPPLRSKKRGYENASLVSDTIARLLFTVGMQSAIAADIAAELKLTCQQSMNATGCCTASIAETVW